MTVGHRVRRRREDEREPDANSTQASPAPALRALLSLQQSAGNQAVSRVLARDIQIRPVDFNPASGHDVPSDIVASKLKSQLKQSAVFMGALNQAEKQKVDRLTTGNINLRAADVPSMADVLIGHIAADHKRAAALAQQKDVLIEIIASVASTKANEAEKRNFREAQGYATSMSRDKGTPNVIPWANISANALGTAITNLAAKLVTRNQYLAALNNFAANDARTTPTGRATYRFSQVRSPHTNNAGWLTGGVMADPEPALDQAAVTWMTAKLANGTPLEQADINNHFAAGPAGVTSLQVEQSALAPALRQDYITNGLGAALPGNDDRISLGWFRYANDQVPGCRFIEFTAEDAGGVSRFIYDYVDNRLYANTHYNWVDGFNPFFQITGGPAMR